VLRHISSSNGSSSNAAAAAPGIGHAAIAEKARRLIAFACDQGWAAVASAVLPLASACGTCAHDIVAAIHDSTAQVGDSEVAWLCLEAIVLVVLRCCSAGCVLEPVQHPTRHAPLLFSLPSG
jgi:hypothetical protein